MWTTSPDERMIEWRHFRLDLQGKNTLQCLEEVAKLWASAPQSNHFLAYDLPNEWPNPWELLRYDRYDTVGLALGIYYTLALIDNIDTTELAINVIECDIDIIAVVLYKGYILNYDFGNVVKTDQITSCTLLYQYTEDELKIN